MSVLCDASAACRCLWGLPCRLLPHKCPCVQDGRAFRRPRRCGGDSKSFPPSACSSARTDFQLSVRLTLLNEFIRTPRKTVSRAPPRRSSTQTPAGLLRLHEVWGQSLTSVIWEPLVTLPLEVGAVKLGTLFFPEVPGTFWTVLRGASARRRLAEMVPLQNPVSRVSLPCL